jgi:hypothetical protein
LEGVVLILAYLCRLFARRIRTWGNFRGVVACVVVGRGSLLRLACMRLHVCGDGRALNMSVATYPEDMLIALSDLLVLLEKGMVSIVYLLEWSRGPGVTCVESDLNLLLCVGCSPNTRNTMTAWQSNTRLCGVNTNFSRCQSGFVIASREGTQCNFGL